MGTLGKSAVTAFSTRKEREWQLNNTESLTFIKPDLHGKPKAETPDALGLLTVEKGVRKYLAFVKTQPSERTWQGYTHTLGQFPQSCTKKYLDEITRRTIANRVQQVVTLLHDPEKTRGKGKSIKDVTLYVK